MRTHSFEPSTWAFSVHTEPTIEPVTVSDAKAFARIDTSADDTLLATLIKAARKECESKTKRQLVTATLDLVLDEFPGDNDAIELPRPPLQSVTAITYVDTDGVTQTLDTAQYAVDTDSCPGRVSLAYNCSWPSTRDIRGAVRIRYVAGWPIVASNATTPDDLCVWIMHQATTRYALREAFISGTAIVDAPSRFMDSLLDAYRIPESG